MDELGGGSESSNEGRAVERERARRQGEVGWGRIQYVMEKGEEGGGDVEREWSEIRNRRKRGEFQEGTCFAVGRGGRENGRGREWRVGGLCRD